MVWNTLLETIYRHYPIGYQLKRNYSGYNEIHNIVNTKIELDIDNPNADCNVLYYELKQALPQLNVINANHHLFPNYITIVELESSQTETSKHHVWLYVVVSLLCDHYTLFVENRYSFVSVSNAIRKNYASFSIFSFEQRFSFCLYPDMEMIKQIIERIFTSKTYISHYALSLQKIITGGTPFGLEENNNREYSFFDYLFYNDACSFGHHQFVS